MHHETKLLCCTPGDKDQDHCYCHSDCAPDGHTAERNVVAPGSHIKKRQIRRNDLLCSYCGWFNSLFSDSLICNCNSTQFNPDNTLTPITVTTQIFLSFIRQRHQSSKETTCNYLHQDLSAGQHTVLIGESLAQVVKDGRALPETKRLPSVKTFCRVNIIPDQSCMLYEDKSFRKTEKCIMFCLSLPVLSQFCAVKSYSAVYYYRTLVSNIMNKTTVKCFVVVCWPADSSPGLLEAIHSVGLQRWEDCPQRGEILQLSALLHRENTRKYSLVIPLLQKNSVHSCTFTVDLNVFGPEQ